MKIVLDARQSGTTTGRYMDKLVEYLYKLKPSYQMVVLAKAHRIDYIKKIAPSFEVIETPYKEFSFGEQLGFKKQIKRLKPDLVHFLMVQQPIFYKGKTVTTMQDLTTTRFRNPSKNPVIFTFKLWVYKFINWYVPRKAQKIITPTEFVKDDVIRFSGVQTDKYVVTYESADKITEKAEPLKALQNEPFIFYTGRPSPHKNLEGLIEAFFILKKKNPGLKLILVGKKDPLYDAIENKVTSRHQKDVLFTGFVSEGELRWLYENCRAYVVPSFSEGFGLPGLEAMVMGAPVVSSSATCLPEVYGKAAAYFDPYNQTNMAEVIGSVISDQKKREQLISLGRKQSEKYSWGKMAKETLAVYKEVLG